VASCIFETKGIEVKQILSNGFEDSSWSVSIAPNPVTENLSITSSINAEKPIIYALFNSNGKLYTIWESTFKTQTIDISNFPSGLYLLKSQNENEILIHKFIK
jgi:hypothetical protein